MSNEELESNQYEDEDDDELVFNDDDDIESNLSNDEQVLEFYKCRQDPIYFIQNYIQLELPGKNIRMRLYKPQKKFLLSLFNDHYCISLKSRQIGISTITQAWIVYSMIFYKNVVVGVVSRDGEESSDFCRKVMSMIKTLPKWMQPKFVKDTERTFILNNGGKLFSAAVSPQNPGKLFRGKSITICVIDEAAFIDKIDDAFTGFGPALFKNQKVAKERGVPYGTVIISTPNKTTGIGSWFFNRWTEANSSTNIETETKIENVYVPHSIHWTEVDEFKNDPEWYKTQCAVLHNDPVKIAQELELKFIASNNSFFPADIVEKLNDCSSVVLSKIYINKFEFHMWEKPTQNKFYLIGVDTASASGSDKSTIEILDYVTMEQVAEYSAKCRVDLFCKAVETVCKIYSRNLIIVENNSYGNQVVEYLTRPDNGGISYNIYKSKQSSKSSSYDQSKKFKYGVSTNATTRPLMIDALFTSVKENTEMIRSKRLALELMGLEKNNNGKVEAGRGQHDDLALALAFCLYVRMYDPPLDISNVKNLQVMEDIHSVLSSNFDDRPFQYELLKEHDTPISQNELNKMANKILKNNLNNILAEGKNPVIDMGKLLGLSDISDMFKLGNKK